MGRDTEMRSRAVASSWLRRAHVLFAAALPVLVYVACGEDAPTFENNSQEIQVTLSTVGEPRPGEEVTIRCRYELDYRDEGIRTWHPQGKIIFSKHEWEYIDGDTAWVDTLGIWDAGEREVRFRVLGREAVGIDAQVWTPPQLPDWGLFGSETLLLFIK